MTPDAFARSALELRPLLLGRAVLVVCDRDEAADLVDGVIATAYLHCATILSESLEPYLQRSLSNAMRNWFQHRRVRSAVSLERLGAKGWEVPAPDTPEHEAAEDLRLAIDRLPPHYSEAILRTYWRDEPQGATKMTVCRARRMLARDPGLQHYAGTAA